jgi:hypothetical protein
MNWQEAKDSTLELWRNIRASIGTAESLDLLVEINGICDLCELANSEAAGEPNRCRYCPAYEQFGGCREVSARLSDLVVQKDWEQLEVMVDDFIGRVEHMEAPGLPAPTNLSPTTS